MCQPWEISNRMQCVSCYYYRINKIAEEKTQKLDIALSHKQRRVTNLKSRFFKWWNGPVVKMAKG